MAVSNFSSDCFITFNNKITSNSSAIDTFNSIMQRYYDSDGTRRIIEIGMGERVASVQRHQRQQNETLTLADLLRPSPYYDIKPKR